MRPIRAIILDFDGVLLESEPAKSATFDDVFEAYPAYSAAMQAYNRAHSTLPRRVKFEHCVSAIMGRAGDAAMVDDMVRRFAELVVDRVERCDEVPGATAFLAEFSARVPLYVSSVTPEQELRAVLHRRGWMSKLIDVFGDPPTPKVDAIRTVLRLERLLPDDVVFIGDSAGDLRAAHTTGVEFVGRNGPFALAPLQTTFVHPDLHAIADVLRPRLRA